ncbi:PD-(D/E)XK nuclease family protein [Pseudanabaena sp. PCC 6802]|uniref:PD-(D/E)XK nuclease family protein n=1 Tax=Pseudanabaena sp. PCC 6802 TaxID=118173 RepID=UPI0003488BD1|nr:PD-(D/E)XK nuclease family protein [Pseudanabaena sp. PCC 6802]
MELDTISQGHLNVWVTCQRKFQHRFLDELSLPTAADTQSKLDLGTKFHLLMQQKELGLDVEAVAASDANLEKWLLAFETNPPNLIDGDRLSEHRRTCELRIDDRDCILSAIYDLLIMGDSSRDRSVTATPLAQIVDWKTHQRPLALAQLQASWQTRLYLYVLARTTSFRPEELAMTYWFANTATAVTIKYDRDRHRETDRDLHTLLGQISQAQLRGSFEQLPLGSKECDRCDFVYRCMRAGGDDLDWQGEAIASYPEVAIYEN